MVTVTLCCAIVGGCTFLVQVDDGESVGALQNMIIEVKHLAPTCNVQLFLAKNGIDWLKENEIGDVGEPNSALELKSVRPELSQVGLSEEEVRVTVSKKDVAAGNGPVNVLVKITGQDLLLVTTPTLKLPDTSCHVLHFDIEKPFICIPKKYIEGSGIVVGEEGLHLYLRQEVKKEWKALWVDVVETYAELWIVGSPGSGKSCAAFAFACSTKRDDNWDILWIHCCNLEGSLFCILFRGESDKYSVEIEYSQLPSLLLLLKKNAVVFLDGYVKDQEEEQLVLWPCTSWRGKDVMCHRLVIVTSMVSLGKDDRPDLYGEIPSEVENSLENTMFPSNVESGVENMVIASPAKSVVADTQVFMLPSWTLENYQEELRDNEFFKHVQAKFTNSESEIKMDERNKLLVDKFYIVGGSARMIFDNSIEKAVNTLRHTIKTVGDITPYVDGSVGSSSECVVNLLLRWHCKRCAFPGFLSEFVAREFAFSLGPEKLHNLAKCPVQNPWHVFKLWFFSSLYPRWCSLPLSLWYFEIEGCGVESGDRVWFRQTCLSNPDL